MISAWQSISRFYSFLGCSEIEAFPRAWPGLCMLLIINITVY